jgi:pectin methylesterase-like acyl-CoA thioesterase
MHRRPRKKYRGHLGRQFRCALVCICLLEFAASGGVQASDYFVNPNGVNGAFPTVQSAVDAVVGQTETERANIFIAPARYVERVTVDKPFLTLIGQGVTPADVNISLTARKFILFSARPSRSAAARPLSWRAT